MYWKCTVKSIKEEPEEFQYFVKKTPVTKMQLRAIHPHPLSPIVLALVINPST